MKWFIFGAGFSSQAIAKQLHKSGHSCVGTTRSATKFDDLHASHIEPVIFSGSWNCALNDHLQNADYLLISIAPNELGDLTLNSARDAILKAPKLQWIGYLSTVGVYGNHDGAWVDEETVLNPVSKRSKWRVSAESDWRELANEKGIPLAVQRLSGIYGPQRCAFEKLANGTARRMIKPNQVFNRIHVEDIARACAFLAQNSANGVFNITDDMPAPPQDVIEYAAQLARMDPPPCIDFETADISPMARTFYGENKRVSNAKIKNAGFAFSHKNYRDALEHLWQTYYQARFANLIKSD